MRLGLQNGFDMSTRSGFRKAAALIPGVKPRYLHISAPCFPFSIMQKVNQRNPEQCERLVERFLKTVVDFWKFK